MSSRPGLRAAAVAASGAVLLGDTCTYRKLDVTSDADWERAAA